MVSESGSGGIECRQWSYVETILPGRETPRLHFSRGPKNVCARFRKSLVPLEHIGTVMSIVAFCCFFLVLVVAQFILISLVQPPPEIVSGPCVGHLVWFQSLCAGISWMLRVYASRKQFSNQFSNQFRHPLTDFRFPLFPLTHSQSRTRARRHKVTVRDLSCNLRGFRGSDIHAQRARTHGCKASLLFHGDTDTHTVSRNLYI